jgi:ribosomal protein S18 acetylase RimI-like enzyme
MTVSSPISSTAPAPARIKLRPLRPGDRTAIERILRDTEAFADHEIAVALELVDLGEQQAPDGYHFFVAEIEPGQVAGYVCFGHTPCTEGTYDLYWIATDPALQGRGIGQALTRAVEEAVLAEHGRLLLIETASKESYTATRNFYLRAGYLEVARVPDFYAVGDDRVIYAKKLG